MTKEQLEGNRLMAQYMGYEIVPKEIHFFKEDVVFGKKNVEDGLYHDCIFETTLKYHESWDRLMPAIDSFGNIDMIDELDGEDYDKWEELLESIRSAVTCCHIDRSFNLSVEMVEWYNGFIAKINKEQ
jgi:hypothetical protein